MDFDDLDDSHEMFEAEVAKQLDEFNAELSGTVSGRIERFGVGENSRAGGLEGARAKRASDSFTALANAAAYQQTVSFNFGGRDVSMSLGDMRRVASDLRNGAASRDKAQAYDGLLRMIDAVAAGQASPEELAEYIKEHDLDQEIYEAAGNDPAITATVTEPKAEESAQAGAYTEFTEAEKNAAVFGNYFVS